MVNMSAILVERLAKKAVPVQDQIHSPNGGVTMPKQVKRAKPKQKQTKATTKPKTQTKRKATTRTDQKQETLQAITFGCKRLMGLPLAENNQATRRNQIISS